MGQRPKEMYMKTMKKYVFFSLGTALLGIFSGLLILEVCFRLFFPQPLVTLHPDIWVPDKQIGHKLASHIDTTINTGERTVRLLTDSQGHRISPSNSKYQDNPKYRILALGDSTLEALAIPFEATMTARLGMELSNQLGGGQLKLSIQA